MTDKKDIPVPPLDGFALILGASSGFGEAASIKLAEAGCDIIGVHLDRRAGMQNVERIVKNIRDRGREAWFYNVNAADPEKQKEVLDDVAKKFKERGRSEKLRVILHSLAFGTHKPFIHQSEPDEVSQKQMEMTLDVM